MEDLHRLLLQRYADLPSKQRQVADVMLASPTATSYSTTAELAASAGVTKATVVRFCQSLGFPGYSELRRALRGQRNLEQLWPLDLARQVSSKPGSGAAEASLRQDLENLQGLLTPGFQESLQGAVTAIEAARRVLVISSGSHAGTGLMLTHNLNFIGRLAQLENRGGSYLGQALATLEPDDLLVSIVFWHTQPELLGALQWCVEQGIATLAITDSALSPTAQAARYQLLVPAESASFFRSQTAPMAAVNALLSELTSISYERSVASMARAQSAWDTLGIFGSSHSK